MTGSIFLIQSGGDLVEMKETPYDSEDLLQELLAKYPNLLAGDQIDSTVPRRWLLIRREMGLASDDSEASRWSIDHLFLDQEGIPTLVETKRSDDTRIRREVAGQMLDYASNAVIYWPIETIVSEFESRCEREGHEPEALLNELLQGSMNVEAFWEQAKTNLQAGRIRMVWVSDVIPRELRRVIEFLNEQMDPAQAIGIEVKMFTGQGLKTMVPHVINPPTKPPIASPRRKQWNEGDFFQALTTSQSAEVYGTAKALLDWANSNSLKIWWGRGKITGSFVPQITADGEDYYPFAVYTSGGVYIQFGVLKTRSTFRAEAKRKELLGHLNSIKGISLPSDAIEKYPGIPLAALKEKEVLAQFLSVLDWILGEIKTGRTSPG